MTEDDWLPRWIAPIFVEDFSLVLCGDKRHRVQDLDLKANGFFLK